MGQEYLEVSSLNPKIIPCTVTAKSKHVKVGADLVFKSGEHLAASRIFIKLSPGPKAVEDCCGIIQVS